MKPTIKKTKDEVIDALMEHAIMETTVECSGDNCVNSQSECEDEVEAAKYFYKVGWRLDEHSLPLCPSCVKKSKQK